MEQHQLVAASEQADYANGEVDLMVRAATSSVRAFCGWHIAPVVTTVVELDSARVLLLPTLALKEIISIETEDATSLLVSELVYGDSGVVTLRRSASSETIASWLAPGRLTVTMRHGLESAPDVEAIVHAIAQRAVLSPGGIVREQAGPFAVTYTQTGFNQAGGIALVDSEKAALSLYTIHGRP